MVPGERKVFGQILHERAHRAGVRQARLVRACALGVLAGLATGCYVHSPVVEPPVPGSQLILDLNDRGRVALGDSLGPSVNRIEGLFRSHSDSAYFLGVTSVRYLSGQSNNWTGEPLLVRKNLIERAQQRRFSRGRTAFLTSAITASVVAFAVSRNLFGLGGPQREPGNGPGSEQ